jgi:L-iditol 2-dehydrogenase
MPERMRVARLHAWGDVRVEEMDIPRAGPGEAVVRIDACGVCGSDALTWYVERKAPAVLGHEPVGTIVEVGEGAPFDTGDRVFVHHHAPCLSCENCRRRLWSNCATWRGSAIDPGGFAEYARVPALNLQRDTLRLPETLDFGEATFIEPLACCIRAVHRQGSVRPEDVVLVVGLGAMGLLMVQLARVYGARAVAGTDFVEARRHLAQQLGADLTIDPARDDARAALLDLTSGRGADVVIVCPGDPRAIADGITFAAPGGRVVCFTPLPPDRPLALDQCALYFREVALLQSYSCGPDETREALTLLAERRITVAPLITHTAGLDGVAAALQRAKSAADGIKTIIFPSH